MLRFQWSYLLEICYNNLYPFFQWMHQNLCTSASIASQTISRSWAFLLSLWEISETKFRKIFINRSMNHWLCIWFTFISIHESTCRIGVIIKNRNQFTLYCRRIFFTILNIKYSGKDSAENVARLKSILENLLLKFSWFLCFGKRKNHTISSNMDFNCAAKSILIEKEVGNNH